MEVRTSSYAATLGDNLGGANLVRLEKWRNLGERWKKVRTAARQPRKDIFPFIIYFLLKHATVELI